HKSGEQTGDQQTQGHGATGGQTHDNQQHQYGNNGHQGGGELQKVQASITSHKIRIPDSRVGNQQARSKHQKHKRQQANCQYKSDYQQQTQIAQRLDAKQLPGGWRFSFSDQFSMYFLLALTPLLLVGLHQFPCGFQLGLVAQPNSVQTDAKKTCVGFIKLNIVLL